MSSSASHPAQPLIRVAVDGSPAATGALVDALRSALAGGPAVLPVPAGYRAAGATDLPPGTAVVVATSGSTGEAKLVALSAAALRASARATAARVGGPARWLLALPAEHVAGVQVIVRGLLAGASPQVLDLRSGFRPDDLAAATVAMGPGRRCTSLVPTQLRRVLDDGGAGLDALRTYAAVLVGGAALDATLHERARGAGVAVVTTYGMSETAGGCVYDGVPLDGVTVDLDADGRILLGGPTLAAGYIGDPTETAAAFVDGRFRTGDLGRFDDGRLEVLGRADDVIITGGEKVAPAAVERVLAAQPGVAAACVTGLPDPEWGRLVVAAIVLDPNPGDPGSGDPNSRHPNSGHPNLRDPNSRDAALRAAVRSALGRAATPRLIVEVPAIPLRGIGKPDRQAVARLVEDTVTDGERRPSPSG